VSDDKGSTIGGTYWNTCSRTLANSYMTFY
jgi:hypothetical protein